MTHRLAGSLTYGIIQRQDATVCVPSTSLRAFCLFCWLLTSYGHKDRDFCPYSCSSRPYARICGEPCWAKQTVFQTQNHPLTRTERATGTFSKFFLSRSIPLFVHSNLPTRVSLFFDSSLPPVFSHLALSLHKIGGGSAIETSFIALTLHYLCIR